ncbi:Holliday junction branch migration protein RuvA [Synoicihabitans lomoniglobus]|uniref:Holliday junction branch migration complex subunit RuvA n=1 Tax=Synoicihabitans lomoniglobus TaxID=2909285 RepID=A0AAF0I4L8_9BACT|nr:Holliday junction branch migration protein RuvA [Opitutaceae bacterium LMO-M01]WED66869.1 Holliday junction branch migration protein RuvA [Opitutaceae bacterium LMO-M01]
MITSITGPLAEISPLRAVVELNGLGYEVHIPVTTAERLPGPGEVVKLHTHVVYREDSQTLYGFAATEDRDFFRLLIEHVSGVGPKVALSIMSRLSLPLLESAIRDGDVATLSKCPGIGKKTAERLVVELRSRVGAPANATSPVAGGGSAASPAPATGGVVTDAVAALTVLGYKTADADKAVRQAMVALGGTPTTEQLIKRALGR